VQRIHRGAVVDDTAVTGAATLSEPVQRGDPLDHSWQYFVTGAATLSEPVQQGWVSGVIGPTGCGGTLEDKLI